jgi:hypothetical protein
LTKQIIEAALESELDAQLRDDPFGRLPQCAVGRDDQWDCGEPM